MEEDETRCQSLRGLENPKSKKEDDLQATELREGKIKGLIRTLKLL
jgi:hypothetical protein